jgi:hypothetical protein
MYSSGFEQRSASDHAAAHQLRQNVGAVAHQPHRDGLPAAARFINDVERVIEVHGHAVAISALQALLDARRVYIHAQKAGIVQGGRQRLGAAHAAHAAGDDEPAAQGAAEVPVGRGREGFESALHNSLAADVDPRAGGHLAVHGEP